MTRVSLVGHTRTRQGGRLRDDGVFHRAGAQEPDPAHVGIPLTRNDTGVCPLYCRRLTEPVTITTQQNAGRDRLDTDRGPVTGTGPPVGGGWDGERVDTDPVVLSVPVWSRHRRGGVTRRTSRGSSARPTGTQGPVSSDSLQTPT